MDLKYIQVLIVKCFCTKKSLVEINFGFGAFLYCNFQNYFKKGAISGPAVFNQFGFFLGPGPPPRYRTDQD